MGQVKKVSTYQSLKKKIDKRQTNLFQLELAHQERNCDED